MQRDRAKRATKAKRQGAGNQAISVIVPENPFVAPSLRATKHCLAALDVSKLIEWWPGRPHSPHRDPTKVTAIQRSLDWKRVTEIAAYLLQEEIVDAPTVLDKAFREIYEPKQLEPGREWPPRVPSVVGFQRSDYPTFSNVLLHVNGAKVEFVEGMKRRAAKLVFDELSPNLVFSVIDGQHRINGAFLALEILKGRQENAIWEIPAEVFLDLDKPNEPPRHQAQIFIDVNYNQKKVDRSLVADLFPTARGNRGPLDDAERAQDIGRRLMLDSGPLIGLIQIPGIRYGVKNVVTLATLNGAIEEALPHLRRLGVSSLDLQTEFIAMCIDCWLDASGRREEIEGKKSIPAENVAYQGRMLVSFLTLLPACISEARKQNARLTSPVTRSAVTSLIRRVLDRAGLTSDGQLLTRNELKLKAYLGSGGLARLRDAFWFAVSGRRSISNLSESQIKLIAERNRLELWKELEDRAG